MGSPPTTGAVLNDRACGNPYTSAPALNTSSSYTVAAWAAYRGGHTSRDH